MAGSYLLPNLRMRQSYSGRPGTVPIGNSRLLIIILISTVSLLWFARGGTVKEPFKLEINEIGPLLRL